MLNASQSRPFPVAPTFYRYNLNTLFRAALSIRAVPVAPSVRPVFNRKRNRQMSGRELLDILTGWREGSLSF